MINAVPSAFPVFNRSELKDCDLYSHRVPGLKGLLYELQVPAYGSFFDTDIVRLMSQYRWWLDQETWA